MSNQVGSFPSLHTVITQSKLIIPLLIFLISFAIRAYGLNLNGLLSTETEMIHSGYDLVANLTNLKQFPTPVPAQLVPKIIYGSVAQLDRSSEDSTSKIQFNYDPVWSRLFASIISSIVAVQIFFIGNRLKDRQIGIIAAIIYCLLPSSIFIGQVVNPTIITLLLTTSILYLITTSQLSLTRRIILILILASLIFGSLDFNSTTMLLKQQLVKTNLIYFLIKLIASTPVIILALAIWGILAGIQKRRNQYRRTIFYLVLVTSIIVYLNHTYSHFFYVPIICLLAANGVQQLITLWRHPQSHIYIFTGLIISLLFSLSQAHPYYSDYYNHLAGGTSQVYKHRTFDIGREGEGLRAAGVWLLNHAEPDSIIGIAALPKDTFPPLDEALVVPFTPTLAYDYIVLTTSKIIQENFNPEGIYQQYDPMHQIQVDGAPLVTIFKRKSFEPVINSLQPKQP